MRSSRRPRQSGHRTLKPRRAKLGLKKGGLPAATDQGFAMMKSFCAALLSFGSLVAPDAAVAQSYPSKTITIVVTAAAGGVSDVVARAVGQRLSEAWGQQVVIDN